MNSKYCLVIFYICIITWTCLIKTSLSAASWCYQCNSNDPGCQTDLSASVMAYSKVPCNGQCYVRVKDGIMYRGCSWEFGFMTPQLSLTPIVDQNGLWVFCDTALCNGSANISG